MRAAPAFALLLVLGACSSRGGGGKEHAAAHDGPRVGGRLVIGVDTEPRNLDQTTQWMEVEVYTSLFLGSGLVTVAPDGRIVPVIARDYTLSPDGKLLTFHLRDDVRYQSGRRVIASDFKATFERILAPATASPLRDLLRGVTTIRAPDDLTLVVALDRPNYLLLLTLADLQPIDPDAFARWGADYGRHPSSAGPYRLKEIRSGESILLERNPDYRWGPSFVHQGPWYFQEIELRVIPEPASQTAALESGEVSMLKFVPEASWARLRGDARFQFFEGPSHSVISLMSNLEHPILSDVRVRQALQFALDREAIVQGALEGHGVVGYGLVSPGTRGVLAASEDPPLARPHDPAAARRLLEEAGWRDRDGDHVRDKDGKRLALRLNVPAGGSTALAAELIQAQLREVGIETTIETFETNTAFQRCARGDYELGLSGFVTPVDAAFALELELGSAQVGTTNTSRYRSAELDELLRRARETNREREHVDALAEAQRLFARDAVFAPIGFPTAGIVVRRSVRGARLSPLQPWLILDDAWLAEGD